MSRLTKAPATGVASLSGDPGGTETLVGAEAHRHALSGPGPTGADQVRREFDFGDDDFDFIRRWIKDRAGIVLADNKKPLVYGRLAKRVRALNLASFKDYCELIAGDAGRDEVNIALNALTTNKTSFFRESHHFDHLASTVLPAARRTSGAGRRLRIWSAGCSSGEEPYSIAMTLLAELRDLPQWDARILATDIDSNMVEHGRAGIYATDAVQTIPDRFRRRALQAGSEGGERCQMADELRTLITFKQLNLLHPWPMKGPFDVIFCRNVVIYFDKPTQMTLFDRYADILKPDGFLYIGHSESLFKVTARFELVGQSTYRKLK
ncbi:MAG: CheR family methyltransferase [Geminicoccaceae bacterium]